MKAYPHNENSLWWVAVDSPVWLKPRRTVYYLTRTVDGRREDLNDKAGRLRTWRSMAAAQPLADTLNAAIEHPQPSAVE